MIRLDQGPCRTGLRVPMFSLSIFLRLGGQFLLFLSCGSLGAHGGAEILQTYAGQTKSYFWEGKWNDSVVKWPVSASLRTINMSPSNLHILKPCLPYTQVITHLLCLLMQCDVWVCSSPLFALRSRRGSARGFFLPPLLAQGSDTIFSLLPTVCWAGVNKNTPTWHEAH